MKNIFLLMIIISLTINCSKEKKEGITGNLILDFLVLQFLLTPPKPQVACTASTNTDPLFTNQWHLSNNGSLTSSVSGEDAKVISVWTSGNLGQGVVVSVVDDGLEVNHEDLKDNISNSVQGYNSRTNGANPSHVDIESGHGTNVGGIIAARYNNGIGVRGAAPCASLVGRNILEASLTSTIENIAMTRDTSLIAVSNNSWGAPDNRGNLAASSSIWQSAIETGLSTGRNNLGTIYTWAAGNGANSGFNPSATLPALTGINLPISSNNFEVDNSNYDGQANFYGVLAICGVGSNGKKANYSEEGANLWVCAHTQGNSTTSSTTAISTTDPTGSAGFNSSGANSNFTNLNYNNRFNGTSAATPLAAGVISLLLQAYPNFSWRDVKEVIARSSRRNDSTDSDWVANGAGIFVNHKYGFGTVDATSAINFARTWTPITGSQIVASNTSWQTNGGVAVNITDNNTTPTTQTISVTGSGISNIEWVSLDFTSTHTYFGDLTVILTSPSGTNSILSKKHTCLTANGRGDTCPMSSLTNNTWRFGSGRHLGEAANGTWTVRVWDTVAQDTGNFVARISFRGR